MIDWYVEITESAPEKFRCDDYIKNVIDTATPFMDHFCKRLGQIKNWKLEDANKIFSEIVEEMPIMSSHVWKGQFSIRYNKWTYIRLTDSTEQIYRESKIKQILA